MQCTLDGILTETESANDKFEDTAFENLVYLSSEEQVREGGRERSCLILMRNEYNIIDKLLWIYYPYWVFLYIIY